MGSDIQLDQLINQANLSDGKDEFSAEFEEQLTGFSSGKTAFNSVGEALTAQPVMPAKASPPEPTLPENEVDTVEMPDPPQETSADNPSAEPALDRPQQYRHEVEYLNVVFETPMGTMQVGYHQVISQNGNLVLVFDRRDRVAQQFKPIEGVEMVVSCPDLGIRNCTVVNYGTAFALDSLDILVLHVIPPKDETELDRVGDAYIDSHTL